VGPEEWGILDAVDGALRASFRPLKILLVARRWRSLALMLKFPNGPLLHHQVSVHKVVSLAHIRKPEINYG
jgi:hypothetical protein